MLEERNADIDDQSSASEEISAICLPGHAALPISYCGPEFPVREIQSIPQSTPAQQSSDDIASRFKQADVLQTEVIDWLACNIVYNSSNCFVCEVLCSAVLI